MGGSVWSADHYNDRTKARLTSGKPVFAYHAATSRAPSSTWKAHASLDPKGVKIRESRDSAAHPESLAIAVLFDVTGSMHEVPQIVQAALPKLMGLLIRKGYVEHPQIMVGGIGDATCDQVPLQIGQFESGIEIDDNLTNLFLEGGGGGQKCESYDLALYFLARHTAIDCFEKRQKRGYAFIVGDEMCRDRVRAGEVEEVLGEKLEADVATADVVAELEKKFDVYYILPNLTSYYNDPEVHQSWVKLLGQNVLRLDDPKGVSELIATTIGLGEGKTDIDRVHDDLKEAGTELATATAVRDALIPVSAGAAAAKGQEIAVTDSGEPSGLANL